MAGDQVFATPGTTEVSAGGVRRAVSGTSATGATTTTMGASTVCLTPAPATGLVFRPLPVKIVSNFVNISSFANLLRGYPHAPLVNFVLHGFQHGFNIGFTGQINEQHRQNNKSARDNHDQVSKAVAKEVERGHTAGPFPYPPFRRNHISPISAAPKPDGTCRLVLDLSQPSGESINDFISKEDFPCEYTHFDAATDLVHRLGRGTYLSKIDIKHAYRLLPVRPEDWPLLVYHWDGQYYVDIKLPFGGRSSASIFTSFADLVCWVLNEKFKLLVIHYSDDFLLLTRDDLIMARKHLKRFKKAFKIMNIPIALDKLIGPETALPYLGIEIDTNSFTVSIPSDKVDEMMAQMPRWCGRRTCTLRELQSLNGRLNFYSKVILPGRMFTRRLIDLTKTVSKPSHHITFNRDAREDIHWWCELLMNHNRSSFIPDPKRVYSTDLLLFTDAAKTHGFGAVYGSSWIQSRWVQFADEGIDFQELFAIVAAVVTWGHHWQGKRVVFVTDNKPITQIWESGASPSPNIMSLIRRLYLFAARSHFSISFKHILGHFNAAADALSRFQMSRFRQLEPDADLEPTPIPVEAWDIRNHVERYSLSVS